MAVNINIPSQVSQTITDGVTDKAPSENAVFDALALKANTADLGATAFSNDYNDLDNLPTIPSVTGFVPYTGATSDLDMGTHNITADHISLNVSPSGAGFGVGATQWNNTIGSSETLLKGGSVTLKNGVDLVARVVNKVSPNTTLTKAAYQAVKVSGAQGGRLAIGLAQGNTDLNSADTIGLVTETIATNQEGFIITVGQLSDINTTGSLQGETWADGDVLYLSPTTAGRLTNIKPTGATGHIVVIGYVEYAHATQGAIYVKIMNGWELDELHNVYINPSTLADNNLLQYDSATSLWKNESLSTAGVQPTLQSGTNIKTINSTSLLGSGNITVIPTHDGATYDTNAIQTLTAAEYAAITPNASTIYFIV
jgi:nitrogen fixation protein